MLHPIPPAPLHPNGDYVEPIHVSRLTVPEPPALRRPRDNPPLPRADALDRRAESDRRARLHFHEGHQRSAPRHEIQIMPAPPEAVHLDPPAAAREIRHGHPLAPEPATMPRIGPLCARDEGSLRGHGAKYGRATPTPAPFRRERVPQIASAQEAMGSVVVASKT